MKIFKHIPLCLTLTLVILGMAGVAQAQGAVTVDLSGSDSGDFAGTGVAHFAGADALIRAMAAINHDDTNGPGTVITIEESGMYEGPVLIGQEDVTIQAADGVVPEIMGVEGEDLQNRFTMYVGARYDGSGNPEEVPASLTLLGAGPDSKMVVYVPNIDHPDGEERAFSAGLDGATEYNLGVEVENVYFSMNDVGNNSKLYAAWGGHSVFTNCVFDGRRTVDGGGLANGSFIYADATAEFNECEWMSNGNWWMGQNSTEDVVVNGGTASGQSLNSSGTGQITFNDFTFTGGRMIQAGVGWTNANSNIVLDNITFEGTDVGVYLDQGQTVTVRNSILDDTSAGVLHARVVNGNLTYENCDITGRPFDWEGVITGNAVLNFDRVYMGEGSFVADNASAESTGHREVNFLNSVIVANPDFGNGVAINVNGGKGEGFTTHLNMTHSVLTGAGNDVLIGNGGGGGQFTANYCIFDNSGAATGLAWADAVLGSRNIMWDGDGGHGAGAVGSIPSDTIIADPMIDAMGRPIDEDTPASAAAFDSTVAWDFEGNERPNPAGTEPDIGAYEVDYMPAMTVTIEGPSMAVVGDNVNLVANIYNAAGERTITWSKDGEVIEGEEFETLPLESIEEDAAGEYSVTVSADNGEMTVTYNLSVVSSLPLSSPLTLALLALAMAIVGLALMTRRGENIH